MPSLFPLPMATQNFQFTVKRRLKQTFAANSCGQDARLPKRGETMDHQEAACGLNPQLHLTEWCIA